MKKEICIITGASRGMGVYYAKYMAEKGLDLVLVALPSELKELKEVKKSIGEKANVSVEGLDLTNMANIEKLYNKYKRKNITTLINNAGFGNYGSFIESSLDKQLSMVDLNIKALHANSHYWGNKFAKQNKGLIINIASIAAFMPGPYMSTYFATKSYVRKLTQAMNWEFKYNKQNVRAVIICPGPVETDFWNISSGTYDPSKKTKKVAKTLLPVTQPRTLVYKAMNKIYKHPKKTQVFVGWVNNRLPLFERLFTTKMQMRFAKSLMTLRALTSYLKNKIKHVQQNVVLKNKKGKNFAFPRLKFKVQHLK